MSSRFFAGTRFSLFEGPKPYFEYNKLKMLDNNCGDNQIANDQFKNTDICRKEEENNEKEDEEDEDQEEEEEEDEEELEEAEEDDDDDDEEEEDDEEVHESEENETTEYRDLSNVTSLCAKLPPLLVTKLQTINSSHEIDYDESSDSSSDENSNPWENDYQQPIYNNNSDPSVNSASSSFSPSATQSVNFSPETNASNDEHTNSLVLQENSDSNQNETNPQPRNKNEPKEHSEKSSSSKSSSTSSTCSNQFLFKDKNCANKILEGLNSLRLSKSLYDIILVVEDEQLSAHKCVLASLSDYFNAMFSGDLSESKQTQVKINSVDSNTMKLVVDYAYTSELNITDHNVQAVLTAANLFNINPLKEACSRYMEWQMEEFNCNY